MTPDLAPGASMRISILLALTATVAGATYRVFGHLELFGITVVMLALLGYVLAGSALRRHYERAAIQPALAEMIVTAQPDAWLVTDRAGTVLHLFPAGVAGLAHSAAVLVGQRFADLIIDGDGAADSGKVRFREMLRFASPDLTCGLRLLAEDGSRRSCRLRVLPQASVAARRAGLIALAGERVD